MTDKEILAELKISYENLRDIRENGCIDHCNGQMKDNIDKLNKAIDYIADIYYDFYKTLNKEDLRVELLEKKVDGDYEVGKDLSCMTCFDLDYFWYEDEDFINE